MKTLKYITHFGVVIVFSLLFHSCLKDIQSIEEVQVKGTWKPGIAIPVINASLNIEDLLKTYETDSLFEIDKDNFITIIYREKPFIVRATDIFSPPPQSFFTPVLKMGNINGDSARFDNDISASLSNDYTMDMPNKAEIKTLIFSEGWLKLDFDIFYRKSGYIVIEIPALTKNGNPYKDSLTFEYPFSIPHHISDSLNLEGYKLDLTKNNTTYNTFKYYFRIGLKGSPEYVHKTDYASAQLSFLKLKLKYIEGFLGQFELDYPFDSTEINLFKSTESGRLSFENPSLNIDLENSIGVPVELDSLTIFIKDRKGVKHPLEGSVVNQVYTPGYPMIHEGAVKKLYQIRADRSNSNLPDIISLLPSGYSNDFRITINPNGKVYENFATDSSEFKSTTTMVFPLYGKTGGWVLGTNAPFELTNIDFIEELRFNLMIENEFPVEGRIQLYFLDSLGQVVDTLIDSKKPVVPAGIAGSDGKTIMPGITQTKVIYPSSRIENLNRVKEIRLEANLSTTHQGTTNVKFYADYDLSIRLSVLIKAKPNDF